MKNAVHTPGFTLVEVLVAITLFTVVMGLCYAGMRTAVRAAENVETRITHIEEMRVVQRFIQGQLHRMLPLTIAENENHQPIRFQGNQHMMRFTGHMPGFLGRGGPYVQTLSVQSSEADYGGDLVINFILLRTLQTLQSEAEGINEQSTENDSINLLNHLQTVDFSYLYRDDDDKTLVWVNQWKKESELPLLIKVKLTFAADNPVEWPLLIVAPMTDRL
jgi:general secretion pathway protein J